MSHWELFLVIFVAIMAFNFVGATLWNSTVGTFSTTLAV